MPRTIPLADLPPVGDEQPKSCVVLRREGERRIAISFDGRGQECERRVVPLSGLTEHALAEMMARVV